MTTEEGGVAAEGVRGAVRSPTGSGPSAAVWLGPTIGCAQCHDHKFDPFTTRDFYSLGAFFADIEEPIIGHREQGMTVTTPDDAKTLARLDAVLAEARCALAPSLRN